MAKPASAPDGAPATEIRKAGAAGTDRRESGGAAPARDPREFLIEIASAVGRESLESLLLTFDGARLEGEKLVLESSSSNEFSRRQIKENLPAIGQAAARITGNRVTVILGEAASRESGTPSAHPPVPGAAPEGDLLEKVKSEPIIKSFLDVFPGPVKAEKIES
jgi:hypothetical protein